MINSEFDLTLLNAARVTRTTWNWQNVISPFARMYMIESGEAKIKTADGIHKMRPGYLYLVPSFTLHSCETDRRFVQYYMHMYNEHDIFNRFDFPFEVEAGELERLLIHRLLLINPDRELKDPDPKIYDNYPTLQATISKSKSNAQNTIIETGAILQLLFMRFMNRATPKEITSDSRISETVRYIRENIKEEIYVRDLAKLCNLHKDYFERLFRRELKYSPSNYITKKKIEKAQIMLLAGNEPIQHIATQLAFGNIPYFHAVFKKIVGISPLQYRKSYLRNVS
ncbi:MAG: AraC family transcriptional regulator [Bacteroidales bacterium]|jgi:AraC-like DNA-binding protein|nr:AraC family transcriptional regulator [Bacteroidales bacterium]